MKIKDLFHSGIIQESLSAAQLFVPSVVAAINSPPRFKSKDRVVMMSIRNFLNLAEEGFDPIKAKRVDEIFERKELLQELPSLNVRNDGDVLQVVGHEGRHRARKLLELGYSTMPVELQVGVGTSGRAIRWSEVNDPSSFDYLDQWPTQIRSEGGRIMRFSLTKDQADKSGPIFVDIR